MKLGTFIKRCTEHNESVRDQGGGAFVDIFQDKRVGETAVVGITDIHEQVPRMFWMGIQDLEVALKTFTPGEYFSDDVTEMLEHCSEELTRLNEDE